MKRFESCSLQVITKLLLKLGWNYIAVVYTDEEYGRTAAAALLQQTELHDICVPVLAAIPTDTRTEAFTTAVRQVVGSLKGNSQAGVSSIVRGAVFIGSNREAHGFVSKLDEEATFVEVLTAPLLNI